MKKLFIWILLLTILPLACAITYDEAKLAIINSQLVLQDFQKEGFSTTFLNDTVIQANIVLEQAKYADILRNSSYSEFAKQEARTELRLVDWKNINYDSVLVYTSLIENRSKQAYEIFDALRTIEKKITSLNESGLSTSSASNLYNQANLSFYEDRYEDAFSFIEKTNKEIEKINANNATFNVLGRNAKNFFYRNWPYILLVAIAILILAYLFYKKIRKFLIKKKIVKMKTQLVVLQGLLIKNQTERFKENKISALVYNIRAKKYEEKIQEIKEMLPVLENRARKL